MSTKLIRKNVCCHGYPTDDVRLMTKAAVDACAEILILALSRLALVDLLLATLSIEHAK